MRLSLCCLLPLPFAAVGCLSNSNPSAASDDAGSEDATVADSGIPAEDAAVDAPGEVDAHADAPADAAAEAASEAGSSSLMVVVSSAAGPEPGVMVILQDPTGAVVTATTTDASGAFTQPSIAAGSQVTLLFGTTTAANILTIQGLEPGDSIPIFDPNEPGTSTATIQSLPPNPPPGTVSYTAVAGACSFGTFTAAPGGSASLATNPAGTSVGYPPCVNGDAFPVLVLANGGPDAGGGIVGYASQAGSPLATDGGPTDVAVGGAWSNAKTASQLTAINWPTSSVYSYGGELAISQISTGVLYPSANIDTSAPAPTQPLSATLYTAYGDSVQTEAYAYGPSGSGLSITDVATRAVPDGGAMAIDMSLALPPVAASVDGTTDPTRPSVAYGSDAGSLASADGAIVVIYWNGSNDGGSAVESTWTIVAPPGASPVQAPSLPASAASWGPFAGASFGNPLVAVVEGTFLTGYAQLRTNVSAVTPSTTLVNGYPHSALLPALPTEGTLRLTAYTVNGD